MLSLQSVKLVKWKKSTRWSTSKASRLTNVIEMEIVSYFHNFWCRFWRDSSTNFWRDSGAFLVRFLYRFWIKSLRVEEKPTITEPTSKKTTLPHVSDEHRSTLDRFSVSFLSINLTLCAGLRPLYTMESFGIWSDCIAVSTLEQKWWKIVSHYRFSASMLLYASVKTFIHDGILWCLGWLCCCGYNNG